MVSLNERIASLSRFESIPIIEVLDEDEDVEYLVIFSPKTNIFIIKSNDNRGEPDIGISYGDFVERMSNLNLNKLVRLDRVLMLIKDAWGKTDVNCKMAFFDSVPLNSIFIGRQYI